MSNNGRAGREKGIKACIFDLDGVLVDTAKYHFLGWQKLAASLGLELTEADHHALKGVGRIESLQFILDRAGLSFDDKRMQELADSKNTWYLEFVHSITPDEILPGVLDFLGDAKRHGYQLAVGSGSKNAKLVLSLLDLEWYFSALCDGMDITHSKPHPEIFLCCCRKLGVEPQEAVVFEDARSGIAAAKRAGCIAVGVGEPSDLTNADFCIPGFQSMTIDQLLRQLSLTKQTGE